MPGLSVCFWQYFISLFAGSVQSYSLAVVCCHINQKIFCLVIWLSSCLLLLFFCRFQQTLYWKDAAYFFNPPASPWAARIIKFIGQFIIMHWHSRYGYFPDCFAYIFDWCHCICLIIALWVDIRRNFLLLPPLLPAQYVLNFQFPVLMTVRKPSFVETV